MLKNILFLLACVALAVLAWGVFQVFGQYTFLIMLVITIAALLAKVGKPKFGGRSIRHHWSLPPLSDLEKLIQK